MSWRSGGEVLKNKYQSILRMRRLSPVIIEYIGLFSCQLDAAALFLPKFGKSECGWANRMANVFHKFGTKDFK